MSSSGLRQSLVVKTSLLIDIQATLAFWSNRIEEYGEMMGAPGAFIKELMRTHNNNTKKVKRVVLKEEKKLLKEVVRLITILYYRHFNIPQSKKTHFQC